MKKITVSFLCVVFALLFCRCSAAKTVNPDKVDIDLTALSSTMVYSEVYDMMINPKEYLGKTVKMKGQFVRVDDNATGKTYYSCVIADATACCQQGLEFVPVEGDAFYDAIPEQDSEITVVGEFQTYTEDELQYFHLINATVL